MENGQQLKSIDAGPVDAWAVTFSPDSKYLASGSQTGKINLYGVESGKLESSLDTTGKFTLSIAFVSKIFSVCVLNIFIIIISSIK